MKQRIFDVFKKSGNEEFFALERLSRGLFQFWNFLCPTTEELEYHLKGLIAERCERGESIPKDLVSSANFMKTIQIQLDPALADRTDLLFMNKLMIKNIDKGDPDLSAYA